MAQDDSTWQNLTSHFTNVLSYSIFILQVASKIPRDLGSGDMKFKIERSFAQNTYELSISDK